MLATQELEGRRAGFVALHQLGALIAQRVAFDLVHVGFLSDDLVAPVELSRDQLADYGGDVFGYRLLVLVSARCEPHWPSCSRTSRSRGWAGASFSYNINGMAEHETIGGTPVTEEQIAAWAAEAEAGYDVEALKKRGRGRPGRGAEPSQVVALRLTADEIAALDARAEREGKSRSEVIREALASA